MSKPVGAAVELECLHCGQTKAQIKRDDTICATETGYEYAEIDNEWPRHRWADWLRARAETIEGKSE